MTRGFEAGEYPNIFPLMVFLIFKPEEEEVTVFSVLLLDFPIF